MLCKVLNKYYYYISHATVANLIERSLKLNIPNIPKKDLKIEF